MSDRQVCNVTKKVFSVKKSTKNASMFYEISVYVNLYISCIHR